MRAFRTYARRGVYPHNYYNNGSLNVWIDGDGHMCAAATMIWKSGARSLVRATQQENTFIRLADVTDGALMDWILLSGLTHAEVVAIQAPIGIRDGANVRDESSVQMGERRPNINSGRAATVVLVPELRYVCGCGQNDALPNDAGLIVDRCSVQSLHQTLQLLTSKHPGKAIDASLYVSS